MLIIAKTCGIWIRKGGCAGSSTIISTKLCAYPSNHPTLRGTSTHGKIIWLYTRRFSAVHLAEFEVLPWFSADFAGRLRGFDFPHLSTAGPIPRNRLEPR